MSFHLVCHDNITYCINVDITYLLPCCGYCLSNAYEVLMNVLCNAYELYSSNVGPFKERITEQTQKYTCISFSGEIQDLNASHCVFEYKQTQSSMIIWEGANISSKQINKLINKKINAKSLFNKVE